LRCGGRFALKGAKPKKSFNEPGEIRVVKLKS
jgi:hypothetical protein